MAALAIIGGILTFMWVGMAFITVIYVFGTQVIITTFANGIVRWFFNVVLIVLIWPVILRFTLDANAQDKLFKSSQNKEIQQ